MLENFRATVAAARDRLSVERIVLLAPGDLIGLKGHAVNFVSRRVKRAVPDAVLPGSITFAELLKQARKLEPRPVSISGDDLAVLQYTGGTTGTAKGAMLLNRNLVANVQQGADWSAPTC